MKHKILTLRLTIQERKKVVQKEIKIEDYDYKQALMALRELERN